MKTRIIVSLVSILLVATDSFAQERIKVGDVWLQIMNSFEAEVISPLNGETYSGEIYIPEAYVVSIDENENFYYSVTTISSLAFEGCNGLTVHIPKSIRRITPSAFRGCKNLTIDAADIVSWCKTDFLEPEYHGPSYPHQVDTLFKNIDHFMIDGTEVFDLIIPEGVTAVPNNAFNSYVGLKSVVLASSINTIGSAAFANCQNLKSVSSAGDGIETLYNGAFQGCSSLTSVTLPSTVKDIGKSAFQGCSSLTTLTWPINLVSLGDSAFKDCSNLKSADLTSISEINKYAFYGCTSLSDIKLPKQIDYIGEYAFYGNQQMKALNIFVDNGIGGYAFAKCTGLTQVCIGYSNLHYPYENIFEGCTNLESVVILPGTISLPTGTFSACTALTSVEFPEGILTIGGAFIGCSSLEEITIPESVANLSDACLNCDNLKSVNIKSLDSWLGMNENSFSLKGGRKLLVNGRLLTELEYPVKGLKANFKYYDYLESISIPEGVYSIPDNAFDGCDNIYRIFCYSETPPHLSNYAFSDKCIQQATVYVPGHLLETYRQNQPDPAWDNQQRLSWSMFKVEPIPDTEKKCATPTIHYEDGKLLFRSDTEGAKFVCFISDTDVGKYDVDEITLSATYHISVYATASNHINSDLVKATLCWIENDPQVTIEPEDITNINNVEKRKAVPMLIQTRDGQIVATGLKDGMPVAAYSLSGYKVGEAIVINGTVTIHMASSHEKVVILKVGKQSIKVAL